MLKALFQKTPTIEEFRQIVFQALWESKDIQSTAPKDLKFTGKDELKGNEYYQFWKSEEQNQLYIAYCSNIKKPNEIIWKGLS